MQRKLYDEPVLEVIDIRYDDIICTSIDSEYDDPFIDPTNSEDL